MKYARVAKMSQNGGDRDRSRDWTLLQMPKCPIYIFPSKLGHFVICDLTWPNSCRIAKMSQKMRYFGICTSFGHVKVADAKMSQFCRENINGTFWHPWKCSITWPFSVTAILGHFGNHDVLKCYLDKTRNRYNWFFIWSYVNHEYRQSQKIEENKIFHCKWARRISIGIWGKLSRE